MTKKKITPEMLGHANNFMNMGFDNMFDGQTEDPNQHLKELLSIDGQLDGKTDLSTKHINALIKLDFLANFLGERDKESGNIVPDPSIKAIIDNFKRLRISHDRKSRKEFVSGIQGSNAMNRTEGMFNRMGNWFRGG